MTPDSFKPLQTGSPLIMVVDDTDGVRTVISIQLRMLGYRVVEAKSGIEAIELIKREPPALILMDIHMPDVDGFETTRTIRQTEGICTTPIIGLSAHHGPEVREEMLKAGFNEFITKPIEFKSLGEFIRPYLKMD
jgi:CheY-like chemotaxis protein